MNQQEQGAGLLIGSLEEAEKAVSAVTQEEYRKMTEAAGRIGMELRKGTFLLQAIQTAEKVCSYDVSS